MRLSTNKSLLTADKARDKDISAESKFLEACSKSLLFKVRASNTPRMGIVLEVLEKFTEYHVERNGVASLLKNP